jgi:hypothetical protein
LTSVVKVSPLSSAGPARARRSRASWLFRGGGFGLEIIRPFPQLSAYVVSYGNVGQLFASVGQRPETVRVHCSTPPALNAVSSCGWNCPHDSCLDRERGAPTDPGRKLRYRTVLACWRRAFIVLDELGYLPFAQTGGQLLFHLISRLYERTSVIVTSVDEEARPLGSLSGVTLMGLYHARVSHRTLMVLPNLSLWLF